MVSYKILRIITRKNSTFKIVNDKKWVLPEPTLDWRDVIHNSKDYIKMLNSRKNNDRCDIVEQMLNLWNKRNQYQKDKLENLLTSLAFQLPNNVHPCIQNYEEDFKLIKTQGTRKEYPFKPLNCCALLEEKDLMKTSNLNLICGERSYYFIADLVKLEQALINFTIHKLIEKGFQLISVPDILPESIIQRSGMPTQGERTQIYRLDQKIYGPEWCLSGTSEMAIAAFLMNSNLLTKELPKYYTAVSRCYRAEISQLATEKGIYRVHQFTKVEMFGVCLPHQSDDILQLFCDIQEDLFSAFNIHYRVIDMAPHELGHHAYRKYDIEAWMPGMKKYGEISSSSNCIDYQARRLNIKSGDQFVHTVNGTACAIPRMMCAISETHQDEKGRVHIPVCLQHLAEMDILGMKRGPKNFRKKMHSSFKRNVKSTS